MPVMASAGRAWRRADLRIPRRLCYRNRVDLLLRAGCRGQHARGGCRMNDERNDPARRLPAAVGKLLCFLGLHDFRVLEVRFGFGQGNRIEKVECRRCALVSTRRS